VLVSQHEDTNLGLQHHSKQTAGSLQRLDTDAMGTPRKICHAGAQILLPSTVRKARDIAKRCKEVNNNFAVQ